MDEEFLTKNMFLILNWLRKKNVAGLHATVNPVACNLIDFISRERKIDCKNSFLISS